MFVAALFLPYGGKVASCSTSGCWMSLLWWTEELKCRFLGNGRGWCCITNVLGLQFDFYICSLLPFILKNLISNFCIDLCPISPLQFIPSSSLPTDGGGLEVSKTISSHWIAEAIPCAIVPYQSTFIVGEMKPSRVTNNSSSHSLYF